MALLSSPSFVVIEGLDGTGKSTVAGMLAERISAVLLQTPLQEFKQFRKKIDNIYAECGIASQLFYSSTVVFASKLARDYVEHGKSVIIDRYWLSTYVYGKCRRESLDLSILVPLLEKPDMTVWLDLDDEVRKERIKKRGKITPADERSFQKQGELRDMYRKAFNLPLTGKIVELDTGTLGPDQCANIVINELTKTLEA